MSSRRISSCALFHCIVDQGRAAGQRAVLAGGRVVRHLLEKAVAGHGRKNLCSFTGRIEFHHHQFWRKSALDTDLKAFQEPGRQAGPDDLLGKEIEFGLFAE